MSPYLLLLALLLFGVAVEAYLKRTPKQLYFFTMFVMGLMFILRYGQGTDYLAYKWIFSVIPENASFSQLTQLDVHVELGWKTLFWGAKKIGVSYEALVVFFSVVEWLFFSRFIHLYCPRKMLALLMAYHTMHLTYMYSALRQGFVLCLFIGVLLPLFIEKKYVKFSVGCVLCAFMHSVALVALLLFVLRIDGFASQKKMVLMVAACFAVGLVISTGVFNVLLKAVLPNKILYYFRNSSVSFATVERIVMYAVMMTLYTLYSRNCVSKGVGEDKILVLFMRIYTLSVMLYCLLMWMPIVASREGYMFKVVEISLLSMFAVKQTKFKKLVPLFVMALSLVIYVKNVDSYINQGRYYDSVNVINYPYVSLLDKERIHDYRDTIYEIQD